MKKFLLFFLLFNFLYSCIPLRSVGNIESYNLVKAKRKSRKIYKKYTKYQFSNYSNPAKFLEFLQSKYDVFPSREGLLVAVNIPEQDIIYDIHIYLKTDQDSYIWLPNLLFKKNKSNDSSEEVVQRGDEEFLIEIIFLDDVLNDCLLNKHPQYNTAINYLDALRSDYNRFRKDPFYISKNNN